MITKEERAKKIGGSSDVPYLLDSIARELSDEELKIFYDNTPDGHELWVKFLEYRTRFVQPKQTTRQEKAVGQKPYGYMHFAREILAEHKSKTT